MVKKAIYLVPIGPIEAEFLGTLAERLEKSFNRSCLVAQGLPEPDYAYDRRRGQYRVEPILERLRRLKVAGAHRLLELVDRDCYTPGLNFVFGQAVVRGREAVVALAPTRLSRYQQPVPGEDGRDFYLPRHLLERQWPHCQSSTDHDGTNFPLTAVVRDGRLATREPGTDYTSQRHTPEV